jgi:hypothetical protein
MNKNMNTLTNNYFKFEEDFVEENVRCIPMIVRFKLDACGVKLKLSEWSKMTVDEREFFATLPCETAEEVNQYKNHLQELIESRTGNKGTEIPVMMNPVWSITNELPFPLQEKLREFNWTIHVDQWKTLTDLQRFALLKLSYSSHENRNFPIAMKEFRLV